MEDTEYTIRHYKHGMAVFGSNLLVSDLHHINNLAEERGWPDMHLGVAATLGAFMALTNAEHADDFAAEAGTVKNPTTPAEWLMGGDTGVSSKAICAHMAGIAGGHRNQAWPDVPHDPSDFGRCYRMLKLFPEWVERIPEMAAREPTDANRNVLWAKLAPAWGELTALYEEEARPAADGKWTVDAAPRMYARMRELLDA